MLQDYNEDEKLKNELTFWDYLWFIKAKKDQRLTLKEIANKLGWNEVKCKKYSAVLTNISSQFLQTANNQQKVMGTENSSQGTYTERWFRDSGLYDLSEESQLIRPITRSKLKKKVMALKK